MNETYEYVFRRVRLKLFPVVGPLSTIKAYFRNYPVSRKGENTKLSIINSKISYQSTKYVTGINSNLCYAFLANFNLSLRWISFSEATSHVKAMLDIKFECRRCYITAVYKPAYSRRWEKWICCLWSPYVIFLPCDFYLSSFFFPRLISAAVDWMSTILPHMVWP